MRNRTRAAYRLAQTLSRAIECQVAVDYHGQRRDSYGGWHVAWCDGPTRTAMEAVVEHCRPRFPEFSGLRLWCDRGRRHVSEAAALLAFLEANPERLAYVNSFVTDEAWDVTEYPERLDGRTQERADALLNLDPTCRGYLTLATQEELRKRALGGWGAVAAWLDELVAARQDPSVTDLDQVRRERRRAGGRGVGGTR